MPRDVAQAIPRIGVYLDGVEKWKGKNMEIFVWADQNWACIGHALSTWQKYSCFIYLKFHGLSKLEKFSFCFPLITLFFL